TSLIGAIVIAGIVVYLHDRFFDTKLPDFLGIFQGSVFVYIVGFIVMIPCALITVIVWPKVQLGIAALQGLLVASGVVGVWIYTFLERILIPTGLHHFIYGPFIFGPAVVENGITAYWTQHIQQFSSSMEPLKVLFPQGGFALHGNSKIFGCTGIALALYVTAKPSKKKIVAGLLIPAVLTAVISGITEPLEFTFLFIAPILFAVHSILAATMSAVMYAFGVVGNFGGGLLDFLFQNWIPMFKNHSGMMFTQIVIGLIFTAVYFFVFKFLIEKMNLATPGREEEEAETKLYTKADYKAKKSGEGTENDMYMDQAIIILEALGGKENIEDLNNCATRLRVSVKDEKLLHADSVFKQAGAHGVVKKGKAIQVIIGLSVPQVRDRVEELMKK
ncbi:MAG: alpha-glucoside-specific PTS transporter subunit IIBC, partial [Leptotrichiaceae bacterium]|nr:alpha-glucoside-specific PTS transporter subunit IIBC [Leptotrichiaceae bacterium]